MNDQMVYREFADGSETQRVTIDEAVIRLRGYGYDEDTARRMLLAGHTLRTPFAYYRLIVPESEARAMDGDR